MGADAASQSSDKPKVRPVMEMNSVASPRTHESEGNLRSSALQGRVSASPGSGIDPNSVQRRTTIPPNAPCLPASPHHGSMAIFSAPITSHVPHSTAATLKDVNPHGGSRRTHQPRCEREADFERAARDDGRDISETVKVRAVQTPRQMAATTSITESPIADSGPRRSEHDAGRMLSDERAMADLTEASQRRDSELAHVTRAWMSCCAEQKALQVEAGVQEQNIGGRRDKIVSLEAELQRVQTELAAEREWLVKETNENKAREIRLTTMGREISLLRSEMEKKR